MSTWYSRVAARLEKALLDPRLGPYPAQREHDDADLRRIRGDLDAIRVRFADMS